jgi:hypothetical protein
MITALGFMTLIALVNLRCGTPISTRHTSTRRAR